MSKVLTRNDLFDTSLIIEAFGLIIKRQDVCVNKSKFTNTGEEFSKSTALL